MGADRESDEEMRREASSSINFMQDYGKDELFGGAALTDSIKTIEVFGYISYFCYSKPVVGQVEAGSCLFAGEGPSEATLGLVQLLCGCGDAKDHAS